MSSIGVADERRCRAVTNCQFPFSHCPCSRDRQSPSGPRQIRYTYVLSLGTSRHRTSVRSSRAWQAGCPSLIRHFWYEIQSRRSRALMLNWIAPFILLVSVYYDNHTGVMMWWVDHLVIEWKNNINATQLSRHLQLVYNGKPMTSTPSPKSCIFWTSDHIWSRRAHSIRSNSTPLHFT